MAGGFPQREFGQLKGQARLAKIAEEKRGDYWGGVTYVYSSQITNDAINSGNQFWEIQPGEDNEMEVLYGFIHQRDSVARLVEITIHTALQGEPGRAQVGTIAPTANLAAVERRHFPLQYDADNEANTMTTRIIISGEMVLLAAVVAVAVSQNSIFSLVARVRGEKPSVFFTRPTGSTVTINADRFF